MHNFLMIIIHYSSNLHKSLSMINWQESMSQSVQRVGSRSCTRRLSWRRRKRRSEKTRPKWQSSECLTVCQMCDGFDLSPIFSSFLLYFSKVKRANSLSSFFPLRLCISILWITQCHFIIGRYFITAVRIMIRNTLEYFISYHWKEKNA